MPRTYRINEIFYSLQGEGFWTGTPAVFVRFSLCNLRCPFCDTDFRSYSELSAEDIVSAASSVIPSEAKESMLVVLTGGEPGLQVDVPLVEAFHAAGFRVHIETNGTRALPEGIDWVTLSPKSSLPGVVGDAAVVLERADEIKVVFSEGDDPSRWASFPATWHFLQPCDESSSATAGGGCMQRNSAPQSVAPAPPNVSCALSEGLSPSGPSPYPCPGVDRPAASSPLLPPVADAARRNTVAAIRYCKEHPLWRLSLQTHKLLGIR